MLSMMNRQQNTPAPMVPQTIIWSVRNAMEMLRYRGFISGTLWKFWRWLAEAQVERLRSLVARTHVELHALAVAQIFEVNFRRQPRAMEKHLVAAVVGRDETEALVLNYLLYSPRHNSFPRLR